MFFSGRAQLNWRDPLLWIGLAFFVYAGISTFFIGLGPDESHIRALRWSVEISFGLVFMFLWMPVVVDNPERWGRIFLIIALMGAAGAIFAYLYQGRFSDRLTGLGVENPIQISSILLVYFAIGHFLLSRCADHLSWQTRTLLLMTLFTVCVAVLLSKSRGPMATMLIYAVFIGLMTVFVRGKREAIYISLFSLTAILLMLMLLNYFFGLEKYVDGLIQRGLSFRLEIWQGYLLHTPADYWLLGFGAGTPADFHPAAEAFWIPNDIQPRHPHNLVLGTFIDTGIIGIGFLSALIFLVVKAIIRHSTSIQEQIHLIGILGLIFMLTITGSQTIISSIKAIWLFFWIPVVFIWFWCRQSSKSALNEKADGWQTK